MRYLNPLRSSLVLLLLLGILLAWVLPVVAQEGGRPSVFEGLDPRYLGFDPESDAVQFLRDGKRLGDPGTPEVKVVRMAQQHGLGYLPLMVMRQHNLIEKHASAAGLGAIRVTWSRFPSGAATHGALMSGLLDFAAGGVAPFLTLWDKHRGTRDIRAVAALESMPLFLNTVNPAVKTLADFGEDDRIALPATGTSVQALLLRMAAARSFGPDQYGKLDHLTVSMSHPRGMQAMLAGQSGVTAHLTSPPFQYQELASGKAHRVS